ncbi:MAG: caspase family protein [Cyanobacteria bacterium SZAS LIN-5]|nr:caspase family protein [Cyanobacteria bacterium SZAS LIN-5]
MSLVAPWIQVKKHNQFIASLMVIAALTTTILPMGALAQSSADSTTQSNSKQNNLNRLPQLVVQSGHTDGVLTCAFSPDSKLIATGGRDNAIRIWETKTGRLIRTLSGHRDPVISIAFNDDGSQLVSGGMDDLVITWNLTDGKPIRKYINTFDSTWREKFGYNAVEQVAFAPDKSIFARYTDASLISWMPSAEQIPPLMKGLTVTEDILPMKMHKTQGGRTDGSRHGNTLKPVEARLFLQTFDGQFPTASFASDVRCMALTIPAKHMMICNAFSREGSSKDWTLKNIEALHPPIAYGYGKPMAAIEIDSKLYLFDMTTGQKTKLLELPKSAQTEQISASKNADQKPADLEVSALRERTQVNRVDGINRFSCAFSPDDSHIVVSDCLAADGGRSATIFNTTSGTVEARIAGHTEAIRSVSYSPDGKSIATTSEDKTVKLWNATTGALQARLGHPNNAVNVVVISPDSSQIIAGSENGSLYFWKPGQDSQPQRIQIDTDSINCLRLSADGKKLASGSNNGNLHITEMMDRKNHPGNLKTINSIGAVAFGDGTQRVIVGTNKEHCASIFDINSGKKVSEQFLPGIGDNVTISSNGTRTALGDGLGAILIYDNYTKKIVRKIQAFQPYYLNDAADIYLWAVAFSNDGKLIAASDDLGNAKIWEVDSGKLVQTIDKQDDAITALSFSSTNTRIALGTSGGDIKIVNLSDQQKSTALGNLQSKINSLCFNKNDTQLVSACENGLISLWNPAAKKQICSMITLPQTESEKDSWAVITEDGRFDTNNLEQISSLAWLRPEEPMTPLPPEIFLRQFFEPNLLPRLVNQDSFAPLPELTKLTTVQPLITNLEIAPVPGSPDQVAVTVSFKSSSQNRTSGKSDASPILSTQKNSANSLKGTVRSGVYDLCLFRDGQLVGSLSQSDLSHTDGTDAKSAEADVSGGSDTVQSHTFKIKLPHNSSTKYVFSAFAFNCDKVKSETKSTIYELAKPLAARKRRAYVIAFGVNQFENEQLNLNFAASDAREFAGDVHTKSKLVSDLENSGNFEQVIPVCVTTDNNEESALTPTKANIKAVIQALSGKSPTDPRIARLLQEAGLNQANAEDFVLLSFATHGTTDKETGEFYLFPSDIGKSQSTGLTDDLKNHCISTAEMTDWLKDLDVSNLTMIIDACHSGAAPGKEFKPGPMDSPGLGQLAYYKKMRLLFASQAASTAQERESLGHGLLTYALLNEGLADDGRADSAPKDAIVTLTEWLKFARDEVPRLDSDESRSRLAESRDLKFDQTFQNRSVALQMPSLLDFSQSDNDITIFNVKSKP